MSIFDNHEEFHSAPVGVQTENENMPAFFDIKEKGQQHVLTFLNPDYVPKKVLPPVHVKLHKLFNFNEGEKFPSWVVDPRSLGQENVLQEYLDTNVDRDSPEYKQMRMQEYYCFTVLRQGNKREDGTRYPAFRQIRLTNSKQSEVYLERMNAINKEDQGPTAELTGLYGNSFYVSRPDANFVPRIGIIGGYVETPDQSTLPEAFTAEEIQQRLIIPTDGLLEYTQRMFGNASPSKEDSRDPDIDAGHGDECPF